jgi:hypothetical protein
MGSQRRTHLPALTKPHGDRTRGTIPKGNRMKKYFIASVVAVMAFAFAAFAASFTINDSVLAVGDGDVEACDIKVVSWGAETDTNKVGFVRLDTTDCSSNEVLFAQVYDGDGNRLTRSDETRVAPAADQTVHFRQAVNIADVESIGIIVHTKTS